MLSPGQVPAPSGLPVVTLPRGERGKTGTWWYWWPRSDGKQNVIICCPTCSGHFFIDRHIEIDRQGRVHGVVSCPRLNCFTATELRLDGFRP